MSDDTRVREVKQQELTWQNDTGWTFQEDAHQRAGTRLVIEKQFERITQALEIQPGQRVLDLGCGTGHLLHWFVRGVPARYHGVDLSVNAVRKARSVGSAVSLASGDAERLPYRDQAFERISCNGAGHHFLDLPAALREVYRVLTPGGRLVMYEPVATPVADAVRRGLLAKSRYESPADLAHKHEFTRRGVEDTLGQVGFVGVVSGFHDFFAYPLSGMYMELPWSRSRAVMAGLSAIERGLCRLTALRPLFDLVSWRLSVVAVKPAG